MKNLLFIAVAFLSGCMFLNAQNEGSFAVGVNVGLPSGDFGDVASFGVGAEGAYLFPVTDNITVGGSVGYLTYFSDEITVAGQTVELDNVAFVPIKAKGMYLFSGSDSGFGIGADLGYALGMNDGNDGGLLYEPKLVYNSSSLLISAGYQGIATDGVSSDSLMLGLLFKF